MNIRYHFSDGYEAYINYSELNIYFVIIYLFHTVRDYSGVKKYAIQCLLR